MKQIRCIIDYETRSAIDLTQSSTYTYANDESTSIFCVGYKINDEPGKIWIPERSPMPDDLWQAFLHGTLVAHNAMFERSITQYTLTRYDTLTQAQKDVLREETAPHRWRCTAAKSAAHSLPRKLEDVCQVLKLSAQKDMRGNALIKKYCKPRKPSKKNPHPWWDDKNDLRRIYQYCLHDLEAEYELDLALPDLSQAEQSVWEMDQSINERGILIDVPLVKYIRKLIREERDHIKREVQRISDGVVISATQTAKVLEWVNDQGVELTNMQAATVRDTLERDDLPKRVRLMLEYRQAASKTSVSKYAAMLRAVDPDGRARELLLYCGADRSGRWSGKRLQPHNFARPTAYLLKMGFTSDEAIELIKNGGLEAIRKRYGKTKVMEVLGCCARGMIIPSPGKELFDADFSAVEARLAFWFADHHDGIKAFKEGRKIYEEMAADIFGMKIEDIAKDSLERFIGKESVLGCQYGVGAPKFMSQCHKKDMKQVTLKISKNAVNAYRKKHWPIPKAWKILERTIIAAINDPGEVYEAVKCDIYVKGNFLNIKLPSGRKLKYFKPRIAMVEKWGKRVPEIRFQSKGWALNPKTGKPHKTWTEVKAWGGVFFNHIVQGTARDFMVHGIKRIVKAKYDFLLSIHDESLAEKKIGKGSVEEFIELMCGDLPDWGSSAPIKAESWKGMRYRK